MHSQPNTAALSPLAIIHWFCVDKNMPESDEKVLLQLLGSPAFGLNPAVCTIDGVRQQLKSVLPTISFTTVLCRKKGKREVNVKPIDPTIFTGASLVNVYSVRDHLSLFLKNRRLSNALIFKPVNNTNGYSSFVSGTYFNDYVLSLPVGVLPLCCMCHVTRTNLL